MDPGVRRPARARRHDASTRDRGEFPELEQDQALTDVAERPLTGAGGSGPIVGERGGVRRSRPTAEHGARRDTRATRRAPRQRRDHQRRVPGREDARDEQWSLTPHSTPLTSERPIRRSLTLRPPRPRPRPHRPRPRRMRSSRRGRSGVASGTRCRAGASSGGSPGAIRSTSPSGSRCTAPAISASRRWSGRTMCARSAPTSRAR